MSYQSEILDILRNEFGYKATQSWLHSNNKHLRNRPPLEVMRDAKNDLLVWHAAWEWLKMSESPQKSNLPETERD